MKKRYAEVDAMSRSLLHLTIPILVTFKNPSLFFVLNGMLILLCFFSSFFETQRKFSSVIRHGYLVVYHICFIIIDISKQGIIYEVSGIIALGVIIVCFVHEILEILYKFIKMLHQAVMFFRRKNVVANINQKS